MWDHVSKEEAFPVNQIMRVYLDCSECACVCAGMCRRGCVPVSAQVNLKNPVGNPSAFLHNSVED